MGEENQNTGSSSIRLIATLGVAGFCSGLALVAVFLFTKPIIEANQAEFLRMAIFQVLPGSKSYKTLELRDNQLTYLDETENKQEQQNQNPRIYAGFDENQQLLGFAIPGEEPGFQDKIKGIFGYDPKQKMIIGFEVLDSKETPGLGDKIIKDQHFRKTLTILKVEPNIVAVKPGQKTADNQVETITGATISSKTVIKLLDKSIKTWKPGIEEFLKKQ